MSREIIININEANKAQKYQKKEELFQLEAFDRVTDILKEHSHGSDTDSIVDCRFHDTIFIDGDRGVGKTAFMLNIEKFYNKFSNEIGKDKINLNDENENDYIFLNPIDPTLLEHTENFLSVILAKIVEMVSKRIENNCINQNNYHYNNNCDKKYSSFQFNENFKDSYFKALENLSKSLTAIRTMKDDLGIEEIASNKSSLKLEQFAHEFFYIVCKMFNIHSIVVLIDDVDMAFEKGFDVLEVVRKYLASPFIIPIVAGDMNLYKKIISNKFNKYLDKQENQEYEKNNDDFIKNLTQQYVHKLFPHEYFIQLENIKSVIDKKTIQINLFNNLELINFQDLKEFELSLINLGINQKDYRIDVFNDNTRDFINYLYTKKNIFKYAFQDTNLENLNNEINNIIQNKFIQNENKHKESLKLTADFYRYSKDEDKQRLSLLLDNDINAFTKNGYSIYRALKGDFFTKTAKPYNKIDKEIIRDKLTLSKSRFTNILNNIKENEELKEFSLFSSLMLHNNYYSNVPTKNLFVTGKFLEYIIYILDNNITDSLKINDVIFAEINKNKYIHNLKDEAEEIELSFEINYDKNENSSKINSNIQFSSIYLYNVLQKYINNINIFKKGTYRKFDDEIEQFEKEANKNFLESTFPDVIRKVIYILLNAFAYFETKKNPINNNIALSSKVSNINNSLAYQKNIKPLIDSPYSSTTKILFNELENILDFEDKKNINEFFRKTIEKVDISLMMRREISFVDRKLENNYKKFFNNFYSKENYSLKNNDQVDEKFIFSDYIYSLWELYEELHLKEDYKKIFISIISKKSRVFYKTIMYINNNIEVIQKEEQEVKKIIQELVYLIEHA